MPRPLIVTGLPRSGTSWTGKMLEAAGQHIYVNEPLNPSHPPGRSPGVLDADVEHYFQYICTDNAGTWLPAFTRTLDLRFHLAAELRRNRSPYDLARAARNLAAFTAGRTRGRAALLDDPYALFSVPWLVQTFDAHAVVLVRDPVTFVGSWRALGWQVDTAELLAQPLLVRDHLRPHREELAAVQGSSDWLASTATLWNASYSAAHRFAAGDQRILLVRHEDLARSPMTAFPELYRRLGLTWTADAAATVRRATSGTAGRSGAFRWSLRTGLSRTAFRPMDSRAALGQHAQRLTSAEADRVRAMTDGVRERLYAPTGESPSLPLPSTG